MSQIPTIIIQMQGGLIQNVVSNHPAKIIILDEDAEGCDPDRIYTIDGCDVIVSQPVPNQDPEYVSLIVEEVNTLNQREG